MVQAASQQITIAFNTQQALEQAEQRLQEKGLSTVKAAAQTLTQTAADKQADAGAPKKRTVKSGGLKAAGISGLMGAIAGGIIATVALNVPNVASIYNNGTPIFVLAVLIGAVFGGAAGGLTSFFAGAKLDQDPTNYRLIVEASPADIKVATATLLQNGGRLL